MRYVTSVERFGIRIGLLKGISLGLKRKFGSLSTNLLAEIERIEDVNLLEEILEALETVTTVSELRQIYENTEPTP